MINSEDFSGASPFYNPPKDGWLLSMWKKKTLIKQILRISLVLLVFLLTVSGTLLFWQKNYGSVQNVPDVAAQIPEGSTNVFANDVSGVSPAVENNSDNQVLVVAVAQSEKYHIKEISFGGNADLLANETEIMPLKITDVRSEVLTSKDGTNSNLMIRWKTNKMAASNVIYEKGVISKTLFEGGYGYSHALVISNLEQSQRYTFSITATDRWGNQNNSDNFSVYTGTKTGSVIDLITTQFKEIFSWTGMK